VKVKDHEHHHVNKIIEYTEQESVKKVSEPSKGTKVENNIGMEAQG